MELDIVVRASLLAAIGLLTLSVEILEKIELFQQT